MMPSSSIQLSNCVPWKYRSAASMPGFIKPESTRLTRSTSSDAGSSRLRSEARSGEAVSAVVMSTQSSMRQHRESLPQFFQPCRRDARDDDARRLGAIGEYLAPRPDDHAVPERAPAAGMLAGLARRDHVALVLDRARPQQHFPMRLA